MVNEFFGQDQPQQQYRMGNNFEFSALQKELDAVRQMPAGGNVGNWANEFQQAGPKLWELTPAEAEAMEKAFVESKAVAGQNASGKLLLQYIGTHELIMLSFWGFSFQFGEKNS